MQSLPVGGSSGHPLTAAGVQWLVHDFSDAYAKQFQNFNEKVQERIKNGDDIFDFPKLIKTYDIKDSFLISKTSPPKIIIASSGMSVGGRIMDHEKKYLPDSKNAILFIGYQASGTAGRSILEKNSKVRIKDEVISVKAEVFIINGYSSHKDSDALVNFVADTAERVQKVFVVMGESKSAMFLAQKLRDNLGIDAIHPQKNQTFEI